jgi:hypothetical protein
VPRRRHGRSAVACRWAQGPVQRPVRDGGCERATGAQRLCNPLRHTTDRRNACDRVQQISDPVEGPDLSSPPWPGRWDRLRTQCAYRSRRTFPCRPVAAGYTVCRRLLPRPYGLPATERRSPSEQKSPCGVPASPNPTLSVEAHCRRWPVHTENDTARNEATAASVGSTYATNHKSPGRVHHVNRQGVSLVKGVTMLVTRSSVRRRIRRGARAFTMMSVRRSR